MKISTQKNFIGRKKNIKRLHLKNKKVSCPSINLLLDQGHKPIMSNEKSINDSVEVDKKLVHINYLSVIGVWKYDIHF